MVFIRKKLIEDDLTGKTAAELVDAGIEKIASQDTSSIPATEDISSLDESDNKMYNWHEILEILSDYINPDIFEQIEDDWMQNYPNGMMDSEAVDDLLTDIAITFNPEVADEVKSRINQLSDPAKIDFSTDIGTLQDTLDKIISPEVKEKIINIIDSLK